MKKSYLLPILTIFSIVSLFGDGEPSVKFISLNEFFNESTFTVLDERFNAGAEQFYMAVHYIDTELLVYDRAIIYSVENGQILAQLIIDDFVFYNRIGTVLYDFSDALYDLRGFSSVFSYPEADRPAALSGLRVDGHFSDELYTSDPFEIDWDPEDQVFVKYEINWDEL